VRSAQFVHKMPFVLSAIVAGHKKDVRCVNALSDGSNYLVTGSRDGSAKIWAPQPIEKGVAQQWHCVTTFAGHKGFVSSVTSRLPDDIYPNVRLSTKPFFQS
jgi:WD40 repeat protein